MRLTLIIAISAGAAFISIPAFAQSTPASNSEKKIGVGADAMVVIPVGDLSDVSGPQLGILGRFGYRVIPKLEVTGRAGYIYGFKKGLAAGIPGGENVKSGVSSIPIWAGARYFFMDNSPAGLYAGAEIGLNFLTQRFEGENGASQSHGTTRFGLNLAVGYVISPELPIDIRAQFIHYNLLGKDSGDDLVNGSESALLGFGLGVGYTFQL